MLHGVKELTPDTADVVVHRGVQEHETGLGSEPGAPFREWIGAGTVAGRVRRYQVRLGHYPHPLLV